MHENAISAPNFGAVKGIIRTAQEFSDPFVARDSGESRTDRDGNRVPLSFNRFLAGQTFVIPTNEYQWKRTAQGIGQLGFIVMSTFVAVVAFRNQLAKLPMGRWFALQPPKMNKDLVDMEHEIEELKAYFSMVRPVNVRNHG